LFKSHGPRGAINIQRRWRSPSTTVRDRTIPTATIAAALQILTVPSPFLFLLMVPGLGDPKSLIVQRRRPLRSLLRTTGSTQQSRRSGQRCSSSASPISRTSTHFLDICTSTTRSVPHRVQDQKTHRAILVAHVHPRTKLDPRLGVGWGFRTHGSKGRKAHAAHYRASRNPNCMAPKGLLVLGATSLLLEATCPGAADPWAVEPRSHGQGPWSCGPWIRVAQYKKDPYSAP
jgi:hypothetical protein